MEGEREDKRRGVVFRREYVGFPGTRSFARFNLLFSRSSFPGNAVTHLLPTDYDDGDDEEDERHGFFTSERRNAVRRNGRARLSARGWASVNR